MIVFKISGLGQGKPGDFLLALLDGEIDNVDNSFTRHGLEQEARIDEAYQLLTSNTTQASGLWIPDERNCLHGLIAASPDRKVMDGQSCVGLCEYKAPVHGLYNPNRNRHGIPRRYMTQIQGQMAVCGALWCDFMAVCTRTKEILLKRVYYNHVYWSAVAAKLKTFISVLQVCLLKISVLQFVMYTCNSLH